MILKSGILYHGTQQKLRLEDLEYNVSSRGKGIYFTNDLAWADVFSYCGQIIVVRANGLKLLVDGKSKHYNKKESEDVMNEIRNNKKKISFEEKEFEALLTLGYDGKIYYLKEGIEEYVIVNKDKLIETGVIEWEG